MTEQKRVLVKEKLAPEGVKFLEDQGFAVDVGTEWDADELLARIKDYDGLIIRSATKVTAEVIQAADKLKVVGRAGVGVDNVDVEEATKRGIIVVNAPASNVLSAAGAHDRPHDGLRAQRPQAYADLKAGKWEKGKWGKGGVELQDKVLGIIGLGRIGFLVAERARGLKMKVLAYDPYVPAERFHELGLDRADSPNRVYREADFITVHLPKNAETHRLHRRRRLRADEGRRARHQRRPRRDHRRGGVGAGHRGRQGGRLGGRRLPEGADHREPAVPVRQRDLHAAPRRLDGRGAAARRHAGRGAGRAGAQGPVRAQRRQHPARPRRRGRRADAVPLALRDARQAHRAGRRHLRRRRGHHLRGRDRPLRHAHPHARRAPGHAGRQGRGRGQLRQRGRHRRRARHQRRGGQEAGRRRLLQRDHGERA